MKVLKFGGTSVGTVESLMNVKHIVEGIKDHAVVVVSALGGLTDRLIATARLAASGDPDYIAEIRRMTERHHNVIDGVVDIHMREDVKRRIDSLLTELKRNYDGIALLRDLPERTLDVIVSFGERMSSLIVSAMINGSVHHDSMEFVKTEKWFDRNIADTNLTTALILKEFENKKHLTHVVPGFISTDRDTGEITNLGRGGSDYTAALIAAALDADILEIWTDVDGFMTADPRIIPDAKVLDHLSFIESMELCSFGAKVIYPPTIYPVFHKNIPIRILNTFNYNAPGTLITDSGKDQDMPIKGVTALRDTCLISLCGEITRNVAEVNSRTYNSLARKGISVFLVSQPAENRSFSFAVSMKDSREAVRILADEYAPELSDRSLEAVSLIENLATVAVVGENIKNMEGAGPRIVNTLLRDGIEVKAGSYDVSETTMSFVVDVESANRALRLIHSLFYNERK